MTRIGLFACVTIAAVGLAGCGQYGKLARVEPAPGPPVPTGESEQPSSEQQTKPTIQARPRRSDEVLRQSQEREADEFDLPPS